MFDWFMLRSTHEAKMAFLHAQLIAAQDDARAKGRAVANARAETAEHQLRANVLQALLDAITTQRRTAAAKGRETQRAKRLAANGASQ